MLLIILLAVWFGYRYSRAGKSVFAGVFVGILTFVAMKVLVTIIALHIKVSTQEQAMQAAIFLNILFFGILPFIIGLLIQPSDKPGSVINGRSSTVSAVKRVPTPSLPAESCLSLLEDYGYKIEKIKEDLWEITKPSSNVKHYAYSTQQLQEITQLVVLQRASSEPA